MKDDGCFENIITTKRKEKKRKEKKKNSFNID